MLLSQIYLMCLLRTAFASRSAPEASSINKYMDRFLLSPVCGEEPGLFGVLGGVFGLGGLCGFLTLVITNPIFAFPVIDQIGRAHV